MSSVCYMMTLYNAGLTCFKLHTEKKTWSMKMFALKFKVKLFDDLLMFELHPVGLEVKGV